MASFEIKKTYNFNIVQELSPILGNSFNLLKVKAITTSDTALLYKDIATEHAQVSGLKSDLPLNISDLTYVIFENNDGEKVIFPLEYIDSGSIKEVQSVTIKAELSNCSTTDIKIIENLLKEAGYTRINITTSSS